MASGAQLKNVAILLLAFALAGCGQSAARIAEREKERARYDAVDAKVADAVAAANLGFEKIAYPNCRMALDAEKATRCGRAVYKVAMGECRRRVMRIARAISGEPKLIDQSAGANWIHAAGGRPAVMSDDERLDAYESDADASMAQPVAVAPGDDTRSIEVYACDLTDFRLNSVRVISRQSPIPNTYF